MKNGDFPVRFLYVYQRVYPSCTGKHEVPKLPSIHQSSSLITFMNKKYRITKIIHQRLKWRKHTQRSVYPGALSALYSYSSLMSQPLKHFLATLSHYKYTKNGQLIHVLKSGCLCMFTGILLHSAPKIHSVNYSSNLNPTGGETLSSAGLGTPNADDHVENNTRMVQMAIHGHI